MTTQEEPRFPHTPLLFWRIRLRVDDRCGGFYVVLYYMSYNHYLSEREKQNKLDRMLQSLRNSIKRSPSLENYNPELKDKLNINDIRSIDNYALTKKNPYHINKDILNNSNLDKEKKEILEALLDYREEASDLYPHSVFGNKTDKRKSRDFAMKKKRKTLRKKYKPLILPNAPTHAPVIKPPSQPQHSHQITKKAFPNQPSLEQRLRNLGQHNDPDLKQAIAKHNFDHSLDPNKIVNAAMTLYGPKSKKVSLVLPDVPTHTPKKRGGKKRKTKNIKH